ncbi:MAG: hypothetical protein QGH97_01115 [Dehalococcoidia bacterium]|jgi:hypothetical protein|nr:hypothetical protein [Dehalococcoidia bacterium]MDP7082959.1 hypothetical protein [Dehalococcoidia bacterium]MDP7201186.1 hypothetical protein [Dehalococcoidia bacterium]HJN87380.1 hypothetical protein [Dehalococcoidia bacterium]
MALLDQRNRCLSMFSIRPRSKGSCPSMCSLASGHSWASSSRLSDREDTTPSIPSSVEMMARPFRRTEALTNSGVS